MEATDVELSVSAPTRKAEPRLQFSCVVVTELCEAFDVNVLFPFMAFMVEDLGYTGNQLGYYTGILAAAFCGAQFCSSVPWGMFSDRYGRRPAIVLGTLGAAFGMLIFGTAKTYSRALLGRLIGGFLNGNIGVLKSFLTEITDETNRGDGFSMLFMAWSIGSIIAPVLGGLLSNPADKYPTVFSQDGLFGYYPYLLPCLICAVWNVFAALWCQCFMIETRTTCSTDSDGSTAAPTTNTVTASTQRDYSQLPTNSTHGGIKLSKKNSTGGNDIEQSIRGSSCHHVTTVEGTEDFNGIGNGIDVATSSSSVLREKTVVMVVCNYGLLCVPQIIMQETLPLFLKLDMNSGGLSFSTSEIGLLLSISGITLLPYAMFVLPMISRYSKFWMFKIGCIGSIPPTMFWPVFGILNQLLYRHLNNNGRLLLRSILLWLPISIAVTLVNFMSGFAFQAINIQLNQSVAPQFLGSVNGMGQSIAALARTVGPALGGVLWSVGTTHHFVSLNFIVVSVVYLAAYYMNQQLPRSLDTFQ